MISAHLLALQAEESQLHQGTLFQQLPNPDNPGIPASAFVLVTLGGAGTWRKATSLGLIRASGFLNQAST